MTLTTLRVFRCRFLNSRIFSHSLQLQTVLFGFLGSFPWLLNAQPPNAEHDFISKNYTKIERMIAMRDGVKLFTSIYMPLDGSEKYPILMERTPYSCSPYGQSQMPNRLGPNRLLTHEKYIFVYQDVRGRYKSEGNFEEMTPAVDQKKSTSQTDESSDAFDTIDWLLKNIPNNNGRVGIYGISYPGFYASASLPNCHPALKAVSPQAPVTDEFIGDDAYHNGAFFLMDNFDFTNYFQGTLTDSGRNYKNAFESHRTDAYRFFLDLGPLKNSNSGAYFDGKAKIWNEYLQHNVYDDYWQTRNIRPHLKDIKPAVLVVGGWFDAEDLFGSLRTYEAIEHQSNPNNCRLVMGPWTHGAWSARTWTKFGSYNFGKDINEFYQSQIETKFFNHYLKDEGDFSLSEATVYETGSDVWKSYNSWPPANATLQKIYLRENRQLSGDSSTKNGSFDQYESDPKNPVPYTNGAYEERNDEYVVEDQRFAAKRPDVLVYQSEILGQDMTVTGRPKADLFISSSGSDADVIVKIIDVLPDGDEPGSKSTNPTQTPGFERLVRAEVFRCKFRKSYVLPQALVPGEITEVAFSLNEIAHDFKKGHRLMIQVQSTWFPLVDINPQQFLNISTCSQADFQKVQIRVYHDAAHPSAILLPVLK
jgi:uncharacterized protein